MDSKCLLFVLLAFFSYAAAGDVLASAEESSPKVNVFCTSCIIGVNEILALENATDILNKTIEICIELGFGNDVFCEGFVTINENEILYIHANVQNLTAKDLCGTVFVSFGCVSDNPDRIYNVTLPDVPKPPVDEPPLAGEGSPTLKVLHLADTHFDPSYYVGADTTNCPEVYLCCRESNGIAADPKDGAGYWGDYRNCDSPKWTLEALYGHVTATHPDIDFIIWTGDIVPHDVWETSKDSNLVIINEMADLIATYFPGIPVFPSVGNHEASPMNAFPQPYVTDPLFDISWLYDELTVVWQKWLPADVATSIAYGAYYSTLIRPGLRVLSVNSNYCYGLNYWLVLDSHDVARELELMAQELQKAEDNGERVYVIGHIPAGNSDCALTWSHEYNKIISRYENTVTGIFSGHTHKDHYQLYFDPSNSSRVYEIGYIAQSQTTYSKLNPGYKVYSIEGDFVGSRYRVLNHENWILDLEASNSLNETVFANLYSAKEDYNLPDLSPQSWLDLVYQMNEPNSTTFNLFYRNYVKAGAASLAEGCDDKCKSGILCRLLISDNSDHSHCDTLLQK